MDLSKRICRKDIKAIRRDVLMNSRIKFYNLIFMDFMEDDGVILPGYEHPNICDFDDDLDITSHWTNEDGDPIYIESHREYNIRAYSDIQQPDTQNEFDEHWGEKMKLQRQSV